MSKTPVHVESLALIPPLAAADRNACQSRLAAVVALEPHGAAIADADFGCIHEHVTSGVPVCAGCLAQHADKAFCCWYCELGPAVKSKGYADSHCCPLMLKVTAR